MLTSFNFDLTLQCGCIIVILGYKVYALYPNVYHLFSTTFISFECSKNVEKAQAKKQEIDDGMADIKKQLAELAEKRQTKEDEMRKLGK